MVVFFREQWNVILSLYSTSLKGGHNTNLKEFVAWKGGDRAYFDYDSLLRRWSDAFGDQSVHAKLFTDARKYEGGLLQAFCEMAELDVTLELDSAQSKNLSLNGRGEALFRFINRIVPRYSRATSRPATARIGSVIRKIALRLPENIIAKGKPAYDEQLAADLRAQYAGSNDRFLRARFPDRIGDIASF